MGIERNEFDLVVVGGGIHGVGVAQAAVAAGFSVLVLEQGTLACATSSRSSKLIHGGLRYLEHGQIDLVRECLRERSLLLKLAPELVRMRRFYIPIYKNSTRNRFTIASGLALYSMLAGGGKDVRFHRLPRRQWDSLDGLNREGLLSVFQYWDAQTDDRALTQAVMASAQGLGAQLQEDAELLQATIASDRIQIRYRSHGEERHCLARAMVNAAGPWVNRVLGRVSPEPVSLAFDMVQGTHLVLDAQLEKGIYYLESPRDARPTFAIPWQEKIAGDSVLLGTTETRYQGDPGEVHPLPEEQAYLLETFSYYFPDRGGENIVSRAFAGLRVLPAGDGGLGAKTRDTVLHIDNDQARTDTPCVLTIYGGKLTAYRATAEKVMALLSSRLPPRRKKGDTRELRLIPVAS
ncbi:MAG: FAD-dependent oxidoreductase [Gammaproteobacteria bacterium]|nr:FAD-dependent oxidoreductase [Gammaproteobacteria bacterium]